MSTNHDSQDSYDRFFPPSEDDSGGQSAGGANGHTWPQRGGAQPAGAGEQPRAGDGHGGYGRYQQPPYPPDQRQQRPPTPPPSPAERYSRPPSPPPAPPGAARYSPPPAAPGAPAERSYSQPPAAAAPPVAEPAQPREPANPREQFWTANAEEQADQPTARPRPEEPSAQPAQRFWADEVPPAQRPGQVREALHQLPQEMESVPQVWPEEATAVQPRSSSWTDPQPNYQQQRAQQPPALPDWMNEPIDSRYVDQRVGDDEESLTFNADRLDLVGKRKLPPGRGWRKWLYRLTFHGINMGLSPAEVEYAEMVETIRQPIRGDYKIGVVSLKGGVGKTTTTVTLGSVFAHHRKGDRVVALDGNPDFGNLVSRVPRQTNTTVKDLLADEDLSRYGDVRHHTSQNIHGLEVVAGERDLAQSERFSKSEYERVMAVLQRHYSLIFTDCGTGLINEAMAGVLDTANSLILVSSVTVDGARAASANIEWLLIHGHQHLVQRAVVILNQNKQGKTSANIEQLKEHFSPYVRAVHVIPFDEHLAEGGEVNLSLLSKKTRQTFEELAELIATDFPSATGKHTREA